MKNSSTSLDAEWQSVPFPTSIEELPFAKPRKILARDYNKHGSIPVVDQGEGLVAGWTADESACIRSGLPLIVFGDHTRRFKFVDFPFAVGADGTQLLKPSEQFNPRFFYYACLQLPLASRGYNRHFTALKEQELPQPPKLEQERIAAVLLKVQRTIEAEERVIAVARELKEASMRELFTRGLQGEPQRQTDLGPLPTSWQVVPLQDVCRLSTGTTPSTKRVDYYQGAVPFIKTSEIANRRLSSATTFISQQAVTDYNLRVYPPGTVLMAMYGQGKTRGQVALLEIAAATTQNAAALQPNDGLDARFLWQYLLNNYERLRSMGSLGHLSHLNLGYLREFTVIRPPLSEQRDISETLEAIDRKIDIHERKRATLEEFFETLLPQVINGEIRVTDLEIDTSEVVDY